MRKHVEHLVKIGKLQKQRYRKSEVNKTYLKGAILLCIVKYTIY